jgi:hypothetical protein
MATDNDSSREIVKRFLNADANTPVDSTIALLQLLANSLVSTIGEEGFESLLFRSGQKVSREFPWLQFDPRSRPADPEFDLLRLAFSGRDPADISKASIELFTTFIDILASLIGEHLTTLILRSAIERAGAGTISKEQFHG